MRISLSPFLLLFAVVVGCSSCEEESRTILNTVVYQIETPDTINDFTAEVSYFSDLYYATGELKEILLDSTNLESENGSWFGKRYLSANDERDIEYFINAKFSGIDSLNEDLKVKVFFNDSILVDEKIFGPNSIEVELKGVIPDKF